MSNVIQFLETLGREPLQTAEYGAAVAALDIGKEERQALVACNGIELNDLLGGRSKMYLMVATPEEDVPEEAPDDVPEFPGETVPRKDH